MIGWLIFIRAKSKRLPYKCYLNLNGKTIFGHLLEKANESGIECKDIYLCTSDCASNDLLVEHAKERGVNILRGSEDFPLKRLSKPIDENVFEKYSHLVRICGDSPLYSFKLALKCYSNYCEPSIFAITNTIYRNFPSGMSIEIYNSNILKTLLEHNPNFYKLEHMSHIIKLSGLPIANINISKPFLDGESIKLTIDTFHDYLNLSKYISKGIEKKLDHIVDNLVFRDMEVYKDF